MISRKEKRLRRLKKHGILGGVMTLIIISGMMFASVALFIISFIYYILDAKVYDEYDEFQKLKAVYEEAKDTAEAKKALSEEDRICIVKDKNGKIVLQTGPDTISEKGGKVNVQDVEYDYDPEAISVEEYDADYEAGKNLGIQIRKVKDGDPAQTINIDITSDEDIAEQYLKAIEDNEFMAYTDSEEGYIYPEENGRLNLKLKDFLDGLENMDNNAAADFLNGKKGLELPIWFSEPVKDGNTFYYKAVFLFEMKDLTFMLILFAGILIMYLSVFILLIINIVSIGKNQKRLNAVIFTDEVTEGRNYSWFLIKCGQFLRKHKNDKYNYAILDLVFVGYRNYCMCHSVAEGERLLSAIDSMVRKKLNRKYEAIAHYASANFVVMLRYGNQQELKDRISYLIEMLDRIDTGHNFNFHVGVSLLPATTDKRGRTVRRKKTLDIDQEYNNACTARATLAEHDKSDIAFFDEKLLEEQRWLDIVQDEQKKALENEEFLVYYQPKYNPVSDELEGAEALIRWQSPKYGFLSPGKFIPIFEKNGFITEIDHYMIQHVARDQKRWMDQGKKCVPISVNVSRAHFIENDLAEQIKEMVDKEGAPHELIEIELTESAFFDDKNAIIETIGKLKEFGFVVSMDDFGSGYSSLNSLKDMPLDVLKLDAEFFRGDVDGTRGQIVVSEAIKLAKKLEMKTVAEGVEIKQQVEFLADQGCDMIQGFYYAKPMPANEFEGRM